MIDRQGKKQQQKKHTTYMKIKVAKWGTPKKYLKNR
jgi:hypothetical protein